MLQFYFLSVLLNVLAGVILVYATDFTKKDSESASADKSTFGLDDDIFGDSLSSDVDSASQADGESRAARGLQLFKNGTFLDDSTFRLVLGIVSALVGLMKLLSVVQNDMPVIGDLLPAVAGLVAAAALLLEFYEVHNSVGSTFPSFIQKIFFDGRKYLGVFCIIAGLMHFVFPRVLFL